MSTDQPRYDEATVELVARELSRISVAAGYRLRERRLPMARAALDALADAGLLLPPDVEANRQYGRRIENGMIMPGALHDPTHYRLLGPWKEITDAVAWRRDPPVRAVDVSWVEFE